MPKTLKEMRILASETAEEARPEDIDYVIAERLALTPSEYELKQDLVLTDDQVKQISRDMKSWLRACLPNTSWATPGFGLQAAG